MSKKKDKIKISFLGNSSNDVTGSLYLISTPNKNILLECGMVQGLSIMDDWKENAKSFPFKPKNIDYLFINHAHIDHFGNTGKLVRDGFEGRIITTEITKALMKPMGLDSANIIRKDAEYLSKKRGKQIYPFYTEDDVYNMLNMIDTYGFDEIYELDDEISFRFLHNSHIIGACQLELFIKNESGRVDKILYTSDLGKIKSQNYYVDEFEKCKNANLVISECTYGATDKNIKFDRNKDLEKLKTTIEQVCNVQKGRLLIPVFSLSRCQQIMTDLYMMYKDDPSFNTKIIVDSPLIWEINKVYKSVLQGDDLKLFEDVCNWENIKFIKDYNESKLCVADTSSKIILSSSGFLNKGRVTEYAKSIIKSSKDHIIFVGYTPVDSLGGKIKNGQKSVTIDGISIKNRCTSSSLNSYSSHIQQKELLNYLKGISADKIILVHGNMDGKIEFKNLLEEELSKINRTTRVVVGSKGMTTTL